MCFASSYTLLSYLFFNQMNVHRYGQACDEYQMGLSVMLRARKSQFTFTHFMRKTVNIFIAETDPDKSKILHNVVSILFIGFRSSLLLRFVQISFYLSKAEQCKAKNEAQQLDIDMAKIQEDTALDNTMLDDSRTKSATQQNCCLQ